MVKESACNARDSGDSQFYPWVGKTPGGENGNPRVLLPGKFYGRLQSTESQRAGHNWAYVHTLGFFLELLQDKQLQRTIQIHFGVSRHKKPLSSSVMSHPCVYEVIFSIRFLNANLWISTLKVMYCLGKFSIRLSREKCKGPYFDSKLNQKLTYIE